MKKCLLIIWLFVGTNYSAAAQEKLLEQDVKADEKKEYFGPNLRHFLHGYLGYGFMAGAPEDASSQINAGSSHEWQFGLRYKFKIAEFYALGLEGTLNPQTFYLKQKEGKTLPGIALHDTEKLRFTNVGLGFFNRINFDKRGNYMGKFIDLGVFGNWMAFSTYIFQDKVESSIYPDGENVTVKLKNLNYLTDFNYGLTARIGLNRYVFYGNYRLSDLFNKTQGKYFAELPRVAIGLQIGMHK